MTFTTAAKLRKSELVTLLADYVYERNHALYAGHYGDALVYVRNQYPTKHDLLVAAGNAGLCEPMPY